MALSYLLGATMLAPFAVLLSARRANALGVGAKYRQGEGPGAVLIVGRLTEPSTTGNASYRRSTNATRVAVCSVVVTSAGCDGFGIGCTRRALGPRSIG